MNLRDLKYVIAVAETLHFGRAAERCFVSQPTLSGQIKKLEDQLGVTLFERSRRGVAVTPAGEAILVHARRAVEQADAIEQLAQAHRDPLAGRLRVGVIPTLGPYLLPLVLLPLTERYPLLKLILSEEVTDSLLHRLREHELDVALIATAPDDTDLEEVPLFDEPFWLAHPRVHPLNEKDEIEDADLVRQDLLLLADGHCLTPQVMEVCHLQERRQAGAMADLRASSLELLLHLVAAGFGCTLVPALAMRGGWTTDFGIIARPLHLANARRRVRMVFRSTFPRRQALDALAEVVRSHLPNTVRAYPTPPLEAAPREQGGVRPRGPGRPASASG